MPLPTTTSYISTADAGVYFSSTFNAAAWAALSTTNQDISLKESTRWLETLSWKGIKCSDTQALQWPRTLAASGCCTASECTTLPAKIIEATCELALQLFSNKTALIGASVTASGTYVKRQKLGDLEVEFDAFPSGTAGSGDMSGTTGPLVLRKFPWLKDMLSCYANVGANSLMLRVRS